jgi:hypothetical protein
MGLHELQASTAPSPRCAEQHGAITKKRSSQMALHQRVRSGHVTMHAPFAAEVEWNLSHRRKKAAKSPVDQALVAEKP